MRIAVTGILTLTLAAYPLWEPGAVRRVLFIIALAAALTLLAAVLTRWPQAVGWGLVGLMLEYGLSLVGRGGIDIGAPLYAAALVVLGELVADLAGIRQPQGPGSDRWQVGRLLIVAVIAGGTGSIALVATALVGESGAATQVIGVAAAGVALVLLVVLANQRTSGASRGS